MECDCVYLWFVQTYAMGGIHACVVLCDVCDVCVMPEVYVL
jgi:hypothetical protein